MLSTVSHAISIAAKGLCSMPAQLACPFCAEAQAVSFCQGMHGKSTATMLEGL